MTGAASSEGGRPLAYRLGQLLAIGEIAARREHDPVLMQTGFTHPDQMLSALLPAMDRASSGLGRRWSAVYNPLPGEGLDTALDAYGETQLTLGYWHERTHIHRAERMTRARQEAGKSRAQWAALLGVSPRMVEAWELHARNVSEEHDELRKIIKKRETA